MSKINPKSARFDNCFFFSFRKRVTPAEKNGTIRTSEKPGAQRPANADESDKSEGGASDCREAYPFRIEVDDIIKHNFKSIDKMHKKLAQTYSPEIAADVSKNIVAVSALQVDLFKLKMKEATMLESQPQIGYPFLNIKPQKLSENGCNESGGRRKS